MSVLQDCGGIELACSAEGQSIGTKYYDHATWVDVVLDADQTVIVSVEGAGGGHGRFKLYEDAL